MQNPALESDDPFAFLPECDLDSPARPAPAPAPVAPVSAGYRENCKACGGSGVFRSYRGFALGKCFKCDGKGFKIFATSAETRQHNAEKTAQTKARNSGELLTRFESQNPEIAAWWKNSTFPFAVSLRESVAKYGDLTEKQFAAAMGCVGKLAAKRAESIARAESAATVDTAAIEKAFAAARATTKPGKSLSLRLRFAGFSVSPAKASSKNAGSLYVKNGETYLGKITGGKFLVSRDCSPAQESAFVAVCADPKGAAIAYGRMTGNCSCCGRELTRADSIALGIGPICAGKFGW